MTTYKNLLKEADKIVKAAGTLNTTALDKAVWSAVQEKARYYADRIARTEDARAWFDGFILETQNDELVWGYRWVLSNRHKYVPFDQCDVCANMDVGYGKGIYPKNKVPSIPRHPHCMCSLEVIYFDEVDTTAPFNPDGARKYIDSLTDRQKEVLFGIDGAKAYAKGEDWQKWLRGWDGFKNPISRLKDQNLSQLMIDGEDAIIKQMRAFKQIGEFPPLLFSVLNSRYGIESNHVAISDETVKKIVRDHPEFEEMDIPKFVNDIVANAMMVQENQRDDTVRIIGVNQNLIDPVESMAPEKYFYLIMRLSNRHPTNFVKSLYPRNKIKGGEILWRKSSE